MKNMKKKSSKKSSIKFIIIDTFLIFCAIILLYQFYQSKKFEERMEQVMTQSRIEREERQKQEQLEEQAEQEELARQEQERLEKIKESLPIKFNMRDKIKITAENQGQTETCSDFARIKAIEIYLNYQGNYNYNFKKAYNYIRDTSNKEDNYNNIGDMLQDLIGLKNDNEFNWEPLSEIDIKNELVNGKPIIILVNRKFSVETLGAVPGDYSGHAMVIIGYDDTKQSWLVLNSWGANWGNNGTIWIRYDSEGIYEIAKETLEIYQ